MQRKNLLGIVLLAAFGFADAGYGQMGQATPEHEVLKQDVGDWDCEMKIWMAGPDSDPMVSKGSESAKMFGDLWVVSEFKADFGGQPFQGRGTIGYDPVKKKYIGTWFDTMNPYMSQMEGTYDKESKTMTMMMKGTGPDGKPTIGKNVSVVKDAGKTRVFSMYNKMPGGKEMVKSMEITYRKK